MSRIPRGDYEGPAPYGLRAEERFSEDQPRDEFGRFTVSSSAGQREGKQYAVLDNHDMQGGKGARRISFHATFKEAQAEAKKLNVRNAPDQVHPSGVFHFHGSEMHKHDWTSKVGHVHASGGTAKMGGARSPSNHGFAAFGPDSPPSMKV